MHLGNGAITPECGVVALGIAVAGAGIAFVSARAFGLDRARTAGALGAAVFAAQLFNVQILPFSSVHLIGGVLLAWTLGPALGLLTMTGILGLQAVLLGDGGLLALGANIINMGLLPAVAVSVFRRNPAGGGAARTAITLGATAFLCTVGGAAFVVLEVAVSRSAAQLDGLGDFASHMIGIHALAGVFEAVATVAIVALLVGLRQRDAECRQLSPAGAGIVAVTSLAVALLSLPSLGLTSTVPDGYQAAIAATGEAGRVLGRIEMVDQLTGMNAMVQSWQDAIASAFAAPEALLVVLATVMAGIVAWAFARCCSRGNWRAVR